MRRASVLRRNQRGSATLPRGRTRAVALEALEDRCVPGFLAGIDTSVGTHPTGVTVDDFNGDWLHDLAVANYTGQSVTVLLGNGDGTFQDAGSTPLGPAARSVSAADFNGDGYADLATSSAEGVGIHLGNGDGSFQPPAYLSTGSYPSGVAVGDYNGDGVHDLAVANYGSASLGVLLGNGDGSFAVAGVWDVGQAPLSPVAGDLNGDTILDIVVVNDYRTTAQVLLGNGDGTFQEAIPYTAGDSTHGVTLGDFNGDGGLDFVVANCSSRDVSVFLNNGDGSFPPPQSYAAGLCPNTPAAADLNVDGILDLVVGHNVSPGIYLSVLLGSGDGSFLPPTFHGTNMRAYSIAAVDFNFDEYPDLAVTDHDFNKVSVLFNDAEWPASPGGAPGSSWPAADVILSLSSRENPQGLSDVPCGAGSAVPQREENAAPLISGAAGRADREPKAMGVRPSNSETIQDRWDRLEEFVIEVVNDPSVLSASSTTSQFSTGP